MSLLSITHKRELPVLLWGFLISFLGSLPPGTTNVLTVQLAATKGYDTAIWFSLGCMIAEVICVSVCVAVMDRLRNLPAVMKSLQWLSLLLILWLVVSLFIKPEVPIPHTLPAIVFGFLLMIINPVQLPFWFGWTTILIERKILKVNSSASVQYIIGIALGSIAASAIFIAGGHAITGWMSGKEKLIQWTFGSAFLVIAIIQITKILRPKVDQLPDR